MSDRRNQRASSVMGPPPGGLAGGPLGCDRGAATGGLLWSAVSGGRVGAGGSASCGPVWLGCSGCCLCCPILWDENGNSSRVSPWHDPAGPRTWVSVGGGTAPDGMGHKSSVSAVLWVGAEDLCLHACWGEWAKPLPSYPSGNWCSSRGLTPPAPQQWGSGPVPPAPREHGGLATRWTGGGWGRGGHFVRSVESSSGSSGGFGWLGAWVPGPWCFGIWTWYGQGTVSLPWERGASGEWSAGNAAIGCNANQAWQVGWLSRVGWFWVWLVAGWHFQEVLQLPSEGAPHQWVPRMTLGACHGCVSCACSGFHWGSTNRWC